jgi:hypothetical protein
MVSNIDLFFCAQHSIQIKDRATLPRAAELYAFKTYPLAPRAQQLRSEIAFEQTKTHMSFIDLHALDVARVEDPQLKKSKMFKNQPELRILILVFWKISPS